MLGKYTAITTIAVNDLENGEYFYESVLGLKKVDYHPLGMRFISGGGIITLYESSTAGTGQGVVAWWVVENVDSMVKRLRKRGVTFMAMPELPYVANDNQVYSIAKDHKVAWFKDPDGNILGIGNK